jgi:hypothetical protein
MTGFKSKKALTDRIRDAMKEKRLKENAWQINDKSEADALLFINRWAPVGMSVGEQEDLAWMASKKVKEEDKTVIARLKEREDKYDRYDPETFPDIVDLEEAMSIIWNYERDFDAWRRIYENAITKQQIEIEACKDENMALVLEIDRLHQELRKDK